MCGHFHFPFSTLTGSSSKIPSSVPLLNFGYSPLFTFQKLKKVELVKNDFDRKGTNSYTSLLLNLISWQMKAYFELIDISAYLHLLLLLLTLKVPLWWTLFESS